MTESTAPEVVRVAALQIEVPDAEGSEARLARVTAMIAALPEVDLILLPEIWNIGYFNFDRYASDAEAATGETAASLAAAAAAKGAYLLAGSIVERDGEDLFNLSMLFDRGGDLVASYRKIHLFGYGSAETRLLKPGQEVVTAATDFGIVGLSTCYDLRFPELYRRQVDQGAEIFLIVSAWPFPRLHHWITLNHARAIENQAYVISCNCAGPSQGRHYLGHSMATDPWGTTVAATDERPTVLLATIDRRVVHDCRAEFPPLHDRVLGRG